MGGDGGVEEENEDRARRLAASTWVGFLDGGLGYGIPRYSRLAKSIPVSVSCLFLRLSK